MAQPIVSPIHPRSRVAWRLHVAKELAAMQAATEQLAGGAWRIAKGTAYLMTRDLADLSESDLKMLARA